METDSDLGKQVRLGHNVMSPDLNNSGWLKRFDKVPSQSFPFNVMQHFLQKVKWNAFNLTCPEHAAFAYGNRLFCCETMESLFIIPGQSCVCFDV